MTEPTIAIPASEYEHLLEMKAAAEGAFPFLMVKVARDRDRYVGWSDRSEMPTGIWTRAEALAEGCPEARLRRADQAGTSSYQRFYDWASAGMVAEQRGFLKRERLLPYARLWLAGRKQEAFSLLEPFEGEAGVRRD